MYLMPSFAFAIGLVVSLATRIFMVKQTGALGIGKNNTVNAKIVGGFLASQLLDAAVLFAFHKDIFTLVAAGLGLLIPKNYTLIKSLIWRS